MAFRPTRTRLVPARIDAELPSVGVGHLLSVTHENRTTRMLQLPLDSPEKKA